MSNPDCFMSAVDLELLVATRVAFDRLGRRHRGALASAVTTPTT